MTDQTETIEEPTVARVDQRRGSRPRPAAAKPKRLWVKRSIAVLMLGTLAIGGLILASIGQKLTVLDYCDLPEARCDACPSDECGDSLVWCCPVAGGPCYEVTLLSACDPEAEYAVICEHGQTNGDGTITCYD